MSHTLSYWAAWVKVKTAPRDCGMFGAPPWPAVGLTPLRDGRWHHIAIVFIPTSDVESAIEVKQYVDRRALEPQEIVHLMKSNTLDQ
jgi:hypothetical protein